MIDFIITHWDSILVVVVFMAIIIFLAVKGKKQIIYKMLYTLLPRQRNDTARAKGQLNLPRS